MAFPKTLRCFEHWGPFLHPKGYTLLGGSWLVLSRTISRVTILITYNRGLITPLITAHEPPSRLSTVYYLHRVHSRTGGRKRRE